MEREGERERGRGGEGEGVNHYFGFHISSESIGGPERCVDLLLRCEEWCEEGWRDARSSDARNLYDSVLAGNTLHNGPVETLPTIDHFRYLRARSDARRARPFRGPRPPTLRPPCKEASPARLIPASPHKQRASPARRLPLIAGPSLHIPASPPLHPITLHRPPGPQTHGDP